MQLPLLSHPNIFLGFEILSFGTYLIILIREISAKHFWRIFEILSCTVFGMILEIGNTYLAHTYSYSPNFLIQVFHVPLAIGCGWATIIYSAMLLSDQYNLPWHIRPYMDALTALILDLSLDSIAIRLRFWTWLIPFNEEWYGVPFENLIGWLLVALVFSFVIRFLRTLNPRRRWTVFFMVVSPALEYLLLFLALLVFSAIAVLPHGINNWQSLLHFNYQPNLSVLYNPEVQLWKLIVLVAILTELVHQTVMGIVRNRQPYLVHFDAVSFSVLTSIHLFFFAALFMSGIYQTLPFLVALSLATFILHLLLHFLPYLLRPKTAVYFFRHLEKSIKNRERDLEHLVDKSLR